MTKKRSMQEKRYNRLYLDKSITRQKQVMKLYQEDINNNGLSFKLFEAQNDIRQGNIQKAKQSIYDIVKTLESGGSLSGYLLEKNINAFGRDKVINNILSLLFFVPSSQLRKPTTFKKAQVKRIKERVQEDNTDKIIFYGLNKDNSREKADLRLIINKKGDVSYRLVSEKTGKYLKFTDTVRKEVDKRRS